MNSTVYLNPSEKKINIRTYDKIKTLGKGSFGETYLYSKDDKLIAVKKLNKDKNSQKAIDNEIKILKKLGKECLQNNVLCFKQIEIYDDRTYIITDYVDGEELFYLYDTMRSMNVIDYCSFIGSLYEQLTKAIIFIHSKKVVHYDIKPENIMIDRYSGVLRLIDFGLSKTGFPRIELSGYTREYSPKYYISNKLKTWNFNTAKSVDTYCLCSMFYKSGSDFRPLGIIQKILKRYLNYMSPEEVAELQNIWNITSNMEIFYKEYNNYPMPEKIYNYMLSLPREFFEINIIQLESNSNSNSILNESVFKLIGN